jgi:hypothetical protein
MILDMIAILYALDENALIIIYALIITYALILLRFKTLRIQDQNGFFFLVLLPILFLLLLLDKW